MGVGGCVTAGRASQETATRSTQTTTAQNGGAAPAPTCHRGYSPLTSTWIVEGSGPLAGLTSS